jgi:hypothetical protein
MLRAEHTLSDNTVAKFDRIRGGPEGIALFTKPSTIKNVQPITGANETFVVQTGRHEELGDTIFVECIDDSGVTRLALPPKVAALIASQRDALTARRRSARQGTGSSPEGCGPAAGIHENERLTD